MCCVPVSTYVNNWQARKELPEHFRAYALWLLNIHTWPAAVAVNGTPIARFIWRHVISVATSEIISPKTMHALAISAGLLMIVKQHPPPRHQHSSA